MTLKRDDGKWDWNKVIALVAVVGLWPIIAGWVTAGQRIAQTPVRLDGQQQEMRELREQVYNVRTNSEIQFLLINQKLDRLR